MEYRHVPVMLNEVLYHLNCRPGKIYADCTLGGSGHSRAILEKIGPKGFLIGIDRDKDAIAHSMEILRQYGENTAIFHGNFTNLPEFLNDLKIEKVDGILADLGVSLHQIKGSGRGFSFNSNEPLDMRMGVESDVTAEYLVNKLDEKELSRIFWEYGEERWSRQIAREIVKIRKNEIVRSSARLAEIVCNAVLKSSPKSKGKTRGKHRIHPATRVFMALRIAVNRELENVELFMKQAPELLAPGGRICVLSFHSLEDRIVKHRMRELEKGCICPGNFPKCVCSRKKILHVLTRKAVRPSAEEIEQNPMARSTILRAAEKISCQDETKTGKKHEERI